jgi:hypothetical protein
MQEANRNENNGKGEEIRGWAASTGLARIHMAGGVDTRMAGIAAAANASPRGALDYGMPPC